MEKEIKQTVNVSWDKSSFPYWFTHWCAYQMTAMLLGGWKFKYLFHDLMKPYLKLIFKYETVRNLHRKYSNHHLESIFVDYEAMVIDWECSQMKPQENKSARGYYQYLINNNLIDEIQKIKIEEVLKKFKL